MTIMTGSVPKALAPGGPPNAPAQVVSRMMAPVLPQPPSPLPAFHPGTGPAFPQRSV